VKRVFLTILRKRLQQTQKNLMEKDKQNQRNQLGVFLRQYYFKKIAGDNYLLIKF